MTANIGGFKGGAAGACPLQNGLKKIHAVFTHISTASGGFFNQWGLGQFGVPQAGLRPVELQTGQGPIEKAILVLLHVGAPSNLKVWIRTWIPVSFGFGPWIS